MEQVIRIMKNNKFKILWAFVAVAMIVLLSGGVAGDDNSKENETEESEQNLTDPIVVDVSVDKRDVELQVERINKEIESKGSSSKRMLYVNALIVNKGDRNLSSIPIIFLVDDEVVENIHVIYNTEGVRQVKQSIHQYYKGNYVETPLFSIPSNSTIDVDFGWKYSPGHHEIKIIAYNYHRLFKIYNITNSGKGVKVELSNRTKESEVNMIIDILDINETNNIDIQDTNKSNNNVANTTMYVPCPPCADKTDDGLTKTDFCIPLLAFGLVFIVFLILALMILIKYANKKRGK